MVQYFLRKKMTFLLKKNYLKPPEKKKHKKKHNLFLLNIATDLKVGLKYKIKSLYDKKNTYKLKINVCE